MFIKKIFFSLFLFTRLIFCIYLPENTTIIFDVDEVLITPYKHAHEFIIDTIKDEYKNGARKLLQELEKYNFFFHDSYGKPVRSPLVVGIMIAMQYAKQGDYSLCTVTPEVVRLFNEAQEPIYGMHELIMKLKKQGYRICCATNRDRLSFDYCRHVQQEIFDCADLIFVAHHGIAETTYDELTAALQDPLMTNNFKHLIQKFLYICSTNQIKHAPTRKPHCTYFVYVKNVLDNYYGPDQNYVFIDDRENNVISAQEHGMIGVRFLNSVLLEDVFSRKLSFCPIQSAFCKNNA